MKIIAVVECIGTQEPFIHVFAKEQYAKDCYKALLKEHFPGLTSEINNLNTLAEL